MKDMKVKTSYDYRVGLINLATREAARKVQRSLRAKGESKDATKIFQRVLVERVIR